MKLDDTKEKILVVAEKLFGRFGFHKTSMDEIAKTARKAKGSLYYHFSSKEDLFREIVSKEIINLKSQLLNIINNYKISAGEKLKAYLTKRMMILDNALSYHETIKADFFEHFEFIDDLRLDLDNWEKEKIKQIILEGIEKKEFTDKFDINMLLDIFIMVLKGLETPFFIQGKYKHFSPYFEDLTGILTKGLSI